MYDDGFSTPPPKSIQVIPQTPHRISNSIQSNGSLNTFGNSGQQRGRKELSTNTSCYEAKDKWRRLEVAPEAIDCLQLVREGTYGRVYSGTVLVKSCNNNNNNNNLNNNNKNNKNLALSKTTQQKRINDNDSANESEECFETRDVLIKTVLGEYISITEPEITLSFVCFNLVSFPLHFLGIPPSCNYSHSSTTHRVRDLIKKKPH